MSRIKSLYPFAQEWQKLSNIFIISDTHFDDEDRPLMGYDLHEQQQCNIINRSLEGKRSTLIHLGDVGNPEWMDKIHAGRKILIKGNHDRGSSLYEPYFDEIYEGPLFISPKILLSHEHINLHFGVNLFGHEHSGPEIYLTETGSINGINLVGNKRQFKAFNLNSWANNGGLKYAETVHRLAIDSAIEKKQFLKDKFIL